MNTNNLLNPGQLAYPPGYSTETALLRVHNDIVMSVNAGQDVFLVFVELVAAAFDTVDHDILLSFLKDFVGVDDTVLKFFQSYLCNRSQCVFIPGALSECNELVHGLT